MNPKIALSYVEFLNKSNKSSFKAKKLKIMSKIYLFSKNGHFFSVGLQGLRFFLQVFFLSNNIPGG